MSVEHVVTLTPYVKIKVDQKEKITKHYGECHGQQGSENYPYCSQCGMAFKILEIKIYEDSIHPYDDVMNKIDESLTVSSEGKGVHIYRPNSSFSDQLPDLESEVTFSITPDVINSAIKWFKETYKGELEIIQIIYGYPPEVLFGVISEYC
jgi:hypothetical protein